MSIPKKHHYIPQWLSKRWIKAPETSLIYGVSKERNGEVIKGWKATPKAVCWERNEYTVVKEDGSKDATLESDFYSRMDNDLNKAIHEIVEMVLKGYTPEIDPDSRTALAHSLVIDAARRNPDQKEKITESAKNVDFKASILSKIPESFSQEEADAVYDELTSDPKHMKLTTNRSRRMLLPRGVKTFTDVPFRYLISPEGKPFVLGNPLIAPSAFYVRPIDPRVAMVFRGNANENIIGLSREGRRKLNADIFAASSRVIATSSDYLRVLSRKQRKSINFASDTDR